LVLAFGGNSTAFRVAETHRRRRPASVMVITCPNCQSRYAVDPLAIGPAGRMVQCARCDRRWFHKTEGSCAAPDIVIRPKAVDASVPAIIREDLKVPWLRLCLMTLALVMVMGSAVAAFVFRHEIENARRPHISSPTEYPSPSLPSGPQTPANSSPLQRPRFATCATRLSTRSIARTSGDNRPRGVLRGPTPTGRTLPADATRRIGDLLQRSALQRHGGRFAE